MTVQEIQEIGFEKAVFGGYDMKSVDTFLERVAEEFASMQKESAALKSKMKVLVDKIEEYRSVEDGMRRALMSAQSIAQETIDKAKAESDQLVATARSESETKVKAFREQIALEEEKLAAAKKNTLEFVARVSTVYQAQAKALADLALSEKLIQEAPQAAPSAQASAEESDAPVQDATRKFSAAEVANAKAADKDFNFGELKFGTDYNPSDVK